MIEEYSKIKELYPFKVEIIVITRNKYEYSFKPLLELDFDDITSEYKPIGTISIQKKHIEKIKEKIPEIKTVDTVFVCCNAGLSRSPAVAKALAHYLHDKESFNYLAYRYPFANKDVFETLLLGLKENDESSTGKLV